MDKVSLAFLVIINFLCGWSYTINAPKFRFGVISHDSAEIFIQSTCAKLTQWIVEYRESEARRSFEIRISSPPYATKIVDLKPATKYQIRIFPVQKGKNITNEQRALLQWREATKFETDLRTVFGRVTLKTKTYNSNYLSTNGIEWKSSLTLIEDSYSALRLQFEDIAIIRIVADRLNRPVVHYRFKARDTLRIQNYKLIGSEFSDSFINSGGAPDGISYVTKTGNKVILFYNSNTRCRTFVERYMGVSRDNGTANEIHLNVAESYATASWEEDGLEVTSQGDLIRDDGRSIGRLAPDTLVMLTPRFLIMDCLVNSTIPMYSEVYGGIDSTTRKEKNFYLKHIDKDDSPPHQIRLKTRRRGNRSFIFIPPVPNAVQYEVLVGDKVVGSLAEEHIKCRGYTRIIIHGFAASKSFAISLRATIKNKVGKQESAIVSRDVPIRSVGCGTPLLPPNLRIVYSRHMRILYFACRQGTQLRGKSFASCQRNGSWTEFPRCEEIPRLCAAPLVKNSLRSTPIRQVFVKGMSVIYSCRRGFILRGRSNLTCIGPHWNNPKPSCTRVQCRVPLLTEHLSFQTRQRVYEVSEHAVYKCDVGYRMKGDPSIKCKSDGSWSSKPPICLRKEVYCHIPLRLQQFSKIEPHKEYYNESDVIRYGCVRGYAPYRVRTATCLPSGNWSAKLPVCQKVEVKCTASSLLRQWVQPEQYFYVGYIFISRCPPGYRLFGSRYTQCLRSGHWSYPRPFCLVDRRLYTRDQRSYGIWK